MLDFFYLFMIPQTLQAYMVRDQDGISKPYSVCPAVSMTHRLLVLREILRESMFFLRLNNLSQTIKSM